MASIKRKLNKIENKTYETKGKVEGRMEQMKKEAENRSANEE